MRNVMINLVLMALVWGVTPVQADQTSPKIPPAFANLLSVKPAAAQTPLPVPIEQLAACCKTCRAGKACGNSCIARSKACHRPPGCACDG